MIRIFIEKTPPRKCLFFWDSLPRNGASIFQQSEQKKVFTGLGYRCDLSCNNFFFSLSPFHQHNFYSKETNKESKKSALATWTKGNAKFEKRYVTNDSIRFSSCLLSRLGVFFFVAVIFFAIGVVVPVVIWLLYEKAKIWNPEQQADIRCDIMWAGNLLISFQAQRVLRGRAIFYSAF